MTDRIASYTYVHLCFNINDGVIETEIHNRAI